MTYENLPTFATNNPSRGETVAEAINRLFRILRSKLAITPNLKIATAYINPAGFNSISAELQAAPSVKLLLGAEPLVQNQKSLNNQGINVKNQFDEIAAGHISWLKAERDLTGFTLEAVEEAKQMVEWLKSKAPDGTSKVEVRQFQKGFLHGKAFISADPTMAGVLAGSSNLTFAGLNLNAELNLGYPIGDPTYARNVINWFDEYWDQSEPFDLASIYEEQWVEHSPLLIFNRMLKELYGGALGEERLVSSQFDLARFQLDGIARMKRLLEENGGVLVADEVGLGKTFLAGELIREATENRRQRVLIICPAALKSSMWDPFLETYGFARLAKTVTYDQVRIKMDPSHPDHRDFVDSMADYAMVVVDEAHNLRNSGRDRSKAVDSVILAGRYAKQVILLTATPVNNSLQDLETLVRYFIRNDAAFVGDGIPSIKKYIKRAQDVDPENLTPDHLFDLMDKVAVRRTRKFVKEHYSGDTIKAPDGSQQLVKFPTPRPRKVDYSLDPEGLALMDAVLEALYIEPNEDLYTAYKKAHANPNRLMLARYTPSRYLMTEDSVERFQVQNAGLLRSALLKRLESSPKALANTLATLRKSHEQFLSALKIGLVLEGEALREWTSSDADDLDDFLLELDGEMPKGLHSAADYFIEALTADAESDLALLEKLEAHARKVSDATDRKFESLLGELEQIASGSRKFDSNGVSSGDRRKVIIFSSYTDTVIDIYDKLVARIQGLTTGSLTDYAGRIAPPQFGASRSTHDAGKSGGVDQENRAQVIEKFAPKSAAKFSSQEAIEAADQFDILITTDVLAEGVNLQQAGQIINYDLPWNPMRIVQRHGRVDRLFSEHNEVHLGLFYPLERLDEMLGLQTRLEEKLARAEAAVGVDNVLPGRAEKPQVILNDRENFVGAFELLLNNRGSGVALSGEEYRRRLFEVLGSSVELKNLVEQLPYGSGSGFASKLVKRNCYVFCIKMADHEEPWFRLVLADENWDAVIENGNPVIRDEKLTSLSVADPGKNDSPRLLPDLAMEKVFNAWEFARGNAHDAWQVLTDPNNLRADIPASFRDAHMFVLMNGGYLGNESQEKLLNRLSVVPSPRVQRSMRSALSASGDAKHIIGLITEVLDDNGILEPEPPKILAPIGESEVRLICWMAVSPEAQEVES